MRSPVPGDHCCLPRVELVGLLSTCVASCITKVRTHPSWGIRGALGTFILADAALNIAHLDTACVVQGHFPGRLPSSLVQKCKIPSRGSKKQLQSLLSPYFWRLLPHRLEPTHILKTLMPALLTSASVLPWEPLAGRR